MTRFNRRLSQGSVFTVRGEGKCFFDLPAVQHVPQPNGAIPRGAGQDGLDWTETQAADWTLVATKDLVNHSEEADVVNNLNLRHTFITFHCKTF